MNTKKCGIVFLFFYIALFCTFSNPILIPREVFVGDTAELSFTIDTVFLSLSDNKKKEGLHVDSLIKDSNDYTIESIVLLSKEHGTGVSIKFIPWKTGSLEFSSFFYENTEIISPQIHIASILEKLDKKDLAPIRAPLLIPGTTWLLYGSLMLCCFIVLVVYFIFKRNKKKSSLHGVNRRVLKYVKQRQRFVKKQCKFLERKMEKKPALEWFMVCNKLIKEYCAHFFTFDFTSYISYTTTDVLNDFFGCDIENCSSTIKDLACLYNKIDAQRFGGKSDERNFELQKALMQDFKKIVDALERSEFIPYSYRGKGS